MTNRPTNRDRTPLRPGASTLFAAHGQPLNPALLDLMQQLGLVAIEIADYHPNFDYTDGELLDRIRGWMESRGLALNSIHAHFEQRQPDSDLADPDESQRRESVALYRNGLAGLARLGGDILVTHHIAIPEPDQEPEAYKRRRDAFVASLNDLAADAGDLGVRLAIENLPSGWRADVRNLMALIEDADAGPAVGICLDTGHRHLEGDNSTAIRTLGWRLITLHIHDNHGQRDEHIMPLDGTINWAPVVAALRAIDYPGVFMYEIGSMAKPQDIPENYRTLMSGG